MLGFRGAARYIAESFARMLRAWNAARMKKVRDDMGLTNVEIMVPFVRTLTEAEKVIELLAVNGLKRGENGLRVIMMCEVPTNAVLAEKFLQHFDGFSIGSNDLTQLTLGLDRDSGGLMASSFDEREPAVKAMLHMCDSGLPASWTSTSASAARARPTIRTSPSGWWRRAFHRSR